MFYKIGIWVYHVSIEDRKKTINLKKKMVGDSIIPNLKKDETISGIVRNKTRRVIVSFQSGFLSVKLSIHNTIIVIAIFIIVIIIIIILLLTLSRAVADIDSKVLINLI